MGQPAPAFFSTPRADRRYPSLVASRPEARFALDGLVASAPVSAARGRGLPLALSLIVHGVLVAAVIIVPILLFEDVLPAPEQAVRAFFASPPQVAPAPPPPPPAPGVRAKAAPLAVKPPVPEPGRFLAPVETPDVMPVDEGLDMGVEGGVPGGVEGGVPGGVEGGVIGGLPQEPPPPPRVVRVGGNIRAPKLVHEVKAVYPELAVLARATAMVILEAQVGTDGRVRSARVLRGHPLFDEAALAAILQWRYQPLLLNGQPTEFVLTVTMSFRLVAPAKGS
jgi:protein TonB